jgi:hypothetical protein
MSAGIYDILAPNNSDFELNIQYTDYNDVPINLSGKQFSFSVKRSYLNIQDDLFTINSDGNSEEGLLPYPNTDTSYGTITITPSTGELSIDISKDTMVDLTPGIYHYSLKMISTTTEIILRGKFEVEGF